MNLPLPKLFRVAFAVLTAVAALAAVCIIAALLIDPELPPDARLGPMNGVFLGQPASIELQPGTGDQAAPTLRMSAFSGNMAMTVQEPAAAVEVFKAYGLPVLLIYALFLAALFELLRRLFRNVSRGESFSAQSVRLVQIVGVSLIVYALVSSIGESWFAYAMYGHLAEHTEILISGTPVKLPPAQRPPLFGFDAPILSSGFLAGLLVLALSEVFRQGLALQRDNELTV
ncbi:MAG: DUF2975 domain-containing protein [Gammaproteobacteria bacterium]